MSINKKKLSHRIGSNRLELTNLEGIPLKNTVVTIEQKQHDFLFGGFDYNLLSLTNNGLDGDGMDLKTEMFKNFSALFNNATLPVYWQDTEPEIEYGKIKQLKKTAEWLKAHGLSVKGHPLCWHSLCPEIMLEMTNSQIHELLLARIERVMGELSGLINIWDAINEPVIMPIFDKHDNGITRLCKEMGRLKLINETVLAAKKMNPDATLLINDFIYTNIDAYEILIDGCLMAGIPFDAIGIQSHMHQGYWGVERTEYVIERFSQFQLPIHFTENTLVSGHNMPADIIDFNDYKINDWPSTKEGEEKQAKEMALHYQTLFTNPHIDSITWWEFVDGNWLGAPVGAITKDGRVKPVYHEIHKLIKEDWWTGAYQTRTDELGYVEVSGFYGQYEITCDGKKGFFSIMKNNNNNNILVKIK